MVSASRRSARSNPAWTPSRARTAPPAFPDDVVVDVHDEDFLSLADRDPDGRVNLKNLLRESLGVIRNVDDLVRLFRDVEPRSAHAAVMRGDVDDYFGDPTWPSPVDPDSIVGVFLRRCCVDFDRLSFEGACKVQSVFAHYVREGEGAYDTLEKDADGISTRDLGDATRRGLRADAAAGDADDAAAEAFASGGAPSHPFDPRGLADVGVRTPAALVAHVARHIHGAVSDVGRTAPGDARRATRRRPSPPSRRTFPARTSSDTSTRYAPKHFPAAVDHLRRHFDSPRGERRRGRPGSILGLRRIDPAPRRRIERRRGIDRRRRGSRAASVRAPRARGGARVVRARRGGAQGAERGCSNRATKRRRVFVGARTCAFAALCASAAVDRSRARLLAPRAITDSVWEPSTGLSSAARARARVWARGAAWATTACGARRI